MGGTSASSTSSTLSIVISESVLVRFLVLAVGATIETQTRSGTLLSASVQSLYRRLAIGHHLSGLWPLRRPSSSSYRLSLLGGRGSRGGVLGAPSTKTSRAPLLLFLSPPKYISAAIAPLRRCRFLGLFFANLDHLTTITSSLFSLLSASVTACLLGVYCHAVMAPSLRTPFHLVFLDT